VLFLSLTAHLKACYIAGTDLNLTNKIRNSQRVQTDQVQLS